MTTTTNAPVFDKLMGGTLSGFIEFGIACGQLASFDGQVAIAENIQHKAGEGYAQDGLVGGAIGALNTLNPLNQFGEAAAATVLAAERGDYRGMAKAGTTAGIVAVTTVVGARSAGPASSMCSYASTVTRQRQ